MRDVAVGTVALLVLPFALPALGLTVTTATEVVAFAIACLGLNVLVGQTGLVSFGHGAWFGLGAYAAGLLQRDVFPGGFVLPTLGALAITAAVAAGFGALILRRRGVYFSLLTLALSALLFVAAFRWTALTGGENGLGGITRPVLPGGFDGERSDAYYWLVAAIAFPVLFGLKRFTASGAGSVLFAIRENENRARFVGYRTARYKLAAFVLSATLTGLAGVLLLYKNRMTSAEPISVAFSGELLAMVVVGGMRSFLGPALGALFFVLFREFLSIYTDDWLLWFGLLFVGFVVFSPTGLVGLGERLAAPFRRRASEAAAMANRRTEALPLPGFLQPAGGGAGPVLEARGIGVSFGAVRAVRGVGLAVADRTLHALIGPNGAGKTSTFNLLSGQIRPDAGQVLLNGQNVSGQAPEALTRAGMGRSFQITSLFPGLSVGENLRLAVQARHPARLDPWRPARAHPAVEAETAALAAYLGLAGIEGAEAGALSYGGQRLLDMGLALATRPRILLLDEPLAGLAAAERERVGGVIKRLSASLPVLLVEHDIDRVFQLADRVTVMVDGAVLLDGTVEDARGSRAVQDVYIGSGTAAVAARPRTAAAEGGPLLTVRDVNVHYGKSHILDGVSLQVRRHEVLALLGRNGAGKSTLLRALTGLAPATGSVELAGVQCVGQPAATIARLGLSYVPQGRGLFAGMTVAQNLDLGALRRGRGDGVRWDREQQLAAFPRLRDRLHVNADQLSGGEQQMVAIARALSGATRVLLLDEPFEGLAPAIVEQLFETFDALRRDVAIIIVDHHLDLALALSDTTVALERGRVIHAGPSAALQDDLDLRRRVLWL